MAEPSDGLKEDVVQNFRPGRNKFVNLLAVDKLHQNVPGVRIGVEVMIEDTHDVFVVHLMQKFDLPDEVLEECLTVSRVVRDVLLAHKVLVNLLVVEQDRLSAGTLPELANQLVVAFAEERYNVASPGGVFSQEEVS